MGILGSLFYYHLRGSRGFTLVPKGSYMTPELCPLPSSKGSEIWALELHTGYMMHPLFRAHTTGTCNYP